MRRATELLTGYAAYHRDRRNIATHFVGVPMIVGAVCILLSRPAFVVAGVSVSAALAAFLISALWYLTRGELVLGAVTSAAMGAMVLAGSAIAAGSTATWLGSGVGLFVAGWVIQFIGHYYEGRKPAFVDDLSGLMVGPMFVVAEALFLLGWNPALQARIEARVGPTGLRDLNIIRP